MSLFARFASIDAQARKRLAVAASQLFATEADRPAIAHQLEAQAELFNGAPMHSESFDSLFERVAASQSTDMNRRVLWSCQHVQDPAMRLAMGIRMYVRRAQEEPHWGKMMLSFGFRESSVRALVAGSAAGDLNAGFHGGRFQFEPEQMRAALAVVAGAVVGSISLCLSGADDWQTAGSHAAEFLLKALGVDAAEAKRLASEPLPALVESRQTT